MEGIQRSRAISGSHSLSPATLGTELPGEGTYRAGYPFTVQVGWVAKRWGREEWGRRGQSEWEHG